MKKVAISAVLIVKNEEQHLADCLKSLQWVEDIVVVDDMSTDRTVEIANSFGVRLFRRKLDLEGKHRNWACSKAKYDWVLIVDADERITPKLANTISDLARYGFRDYESRNVFGFDLPMRMFIGNFRVLFPGWDPAYQTRLFNRKYIWWAEEEIHPRLLCTNETKVNREKIDPEYGYVIHFSYAGFFHLLAKVNRQTDLEAEKRLRLGRAKNGFYWFRRSISHFLKSYFVKGGWQSGLIGFYISFCDGLYQLITYFKIRERKKIEEFKNKKIIFLDRDGVINEFPGHGDYVKKRDEFRFIPGSIEALKRLKRAGYEIFIVSNQAGVGKGIFSKEQLIDLSSYMVSELSRKGIMVNKVFYCTHRPEENCPYRKPGTKFLDTVLKRYNGIPLDSVYMVGDSEKDILTGKNVGIRTALVLSGATEKYIAGQWPFPPDCVYDNLLHFVEEELNLK